MFVSCFNLRQCCACVEESVCQGCVVFCRVNHVGNHTCVDEDVQCNLFDCLGCTVVSAVLHCLYAIFQQRLCAACCQCNACLFLQCQLMISASCGESYLCFLTHAIADACPQECSGCFCDNLCRDEDMYGGSVHAEEGAELMVGVVVNPQRGVTSACRCNGGECEVRLIHSVCQQLACVDCLAAAQTENHICIFHDFILFQFIYSLEGCFTGEQDIINLYNTVLCCFIQIFLCCVDRNFITDDNSLCTIGRAYLVDFLVSIFTCGIAGEKYSIVCHNYIPPKKFKFSKTSSLF